MKMLGQDLLTQQEFDTFKAQEYDKLVQTLATTKKWLTGLSLAVVVLASTDIFLYVKFVA